MYFHSWGSFRTLGEDAVRKPVTRPRLRSQDDDADACAVGAPRARRVEGRSLPCAVLTFPSAAER